MGKRSSGFWVGAILVVVVAGIGYRYQRQKRIEAEIAAELKDAEFEKERVRSKRVDDALSGADRPPPSRPVRECGGLPPRELGIELDATDPQTRSINEALAYWTFAQDAGTRSPSLHVGELPVRLLASSSGWHTCLEASEHDLDLTLGSRDGGSFTFEALSAGVVRVRAQAPSRLDDEVLFSPDALTKLPTKGAPVVLVPRADAVFVADSKVKGALGKAARLAVDAVSGNDSELQPLYATPLALTPRGWQAWNGTPDAASRANVNRFTHVLQSSILSWKLAGFAALQTARSGNEVVELREVADVNHEGETSFIEREEAALDPGRSELMMEGFPVVTYECIPDCPGYSLSWKSFRAAPGTVATPLEFEGQPLTGWARVRRIRPVAMLGEVAGVKRVAPRKAPETP